MAQDVKSSNVNPAKNVVKVNILRANVKQTKVIDTDIVFVLEDGRTVFIRDGAVQSLLDNGFSVEFSDGALISGQELLQSAGTAELSSIALTGPQASANDGVIVVQAPQATVASEVEKSSSRSGLTTWLAVGTPVVGGVLAGVLAGGGGSSTTPNNNNSGTVKPATPVINVIANDDKVDATEKAAGVTVSGISDASASVTVNWGTTTKTVTADSAGRWSASFASTEVPADAAGTTVSATVKSTAGVSSDPAIKTVQIDATPPGSPVIAKVAGDGIIGPAEKAAGISINGTAEAGSTVTVVFGTVSKSVIADIGGNWSVNYTSAEVPNPGAYSVTATIRDANGNVSAAPATSQVTVSAAVDVTGQVIAGPLVAGHGLSVDIFLANGTLLVSGVKVNTDGSFTVANLLAGVGDVIIAKVVDSTTGADYLDETTRVPTDLNAELLAVKVVDGTSVTMNVNPLTTIAAIKAGLAADGTGTVANAAAATNANMAVAQAFGIPGIDITTTSVVATNSNGFSQAGGLSSGEKVGAVLAALSGYDSWNKGNSQTSITMLSNMLSVEGSKGLLANEGQVALMQGAIVAEDQVDGSLQTVISNTVAESSPTSQVTINAVATDNIIAGSEVSSLTLSGKVTSEVVSASILFSTRKVAATINGLEWSYKLSAEDLAALGGDGPKIIDAQAILANGTTVTSSRLVSLKTSPPETPTLDKVTGDGAINSEEKTEGVAFTGKGEPGSTVIVKFGTTTKEVVVSAARTWTIPFSTAEIPADGPSEISLSAKDAFGNASGEVKLSISIDTVAPAAPNILPVTGDDLLGPSDKTGGFKIQGMAEGGANIRLTLGNEVRTATADALGNWTVDILSSQVPGDGEYAVTVTQSDAAGNISAEATKTIRVDALPPGKPTILSLSSGNIINTKEKNIDGVTVRGTTEANATIEVTWGSLTRTTKANSLGNWSLYYLGTQIPSDGNSEITAFATDGSGNRSERSDALKVIVDTTVEDVTIDLVAKDDVINAEDKAAGVRITGKAEAGATVVVKLGASEETASANAQGVWSVTFASSKIPADIASITVTAQSTDQAENVSALAQRNIRIDTLGPKLPTIDDVSGDNTIDGRDVTSPVTVTGGAAAGTTVTVTWGIAVREVVVPANGRWSVTFAATDIPPEGESVISATSRDSDLNVSTAIPRTVLIDTGTIAPVIDDVTGDNLLNSQDRIDGVTVTGTAEAEATVTLVWGSVTKTVKAGADRKWSQFFATNEIPVSGEVSMTASVTDKWGNTGPDAAPKKITIDTTVLPATFDNVTPNNIVNASEKDAATGVKVSGMAEVGSSVVVTWGTTVKEKVTADATTGKWEVIFTTAQIPADGPTTITAVVTDVAGNVSTQSAWPVTIDTAPPAAPEINTPIAGLDNTVSNPERTAGVEVTGKAVANATVTVTWSETASGIVSGTKIVTADASGVWKAKFENADISGAGDATIRATQTDAAGNVSDAARATVNVSAGPPVAPVINDVSNGDIVTAVDKAAGVTINGTGVAGATINLTWGAVTAQTTVKADLSWEIKLGAGVGPADGATIVSATQTDAAGNVSAARTRPVTVDTTPPNAPVIETPFAFGDSINADEKSNGVTIFATAPGSTKVEIKIGNVTKSATLDGTGKWSAKFESGDIPADQTGVRVEARGLDALDNASAWAQASVPITIDTVAADLPKITTPIAGDGVILATERTNGFFISGTGPANTTVEVRIGGLTPVIVTSDTLGNWLARFAGNNVPLLDGTDANGVESTTNVEARTKDAAGNYSAWVGKSDGTPLTVKIDTLPPSAPQISNDTLKIAEDNVINLKEKTDGVTIAGTAPSGNTVEVRIGGGTPKVATFTASVAWSVTFDSNEIPADGKDILVEARTKDAAGNYSLWTAANSKIEVDTVAPSDLPTVVGQIAGNDIINASEKANGDGVNVSVSASGATTVEVKIGSVVKTAILDAAGKGTANFTTAEIPADGKNIPVEGRSLDAAGNVGAWTQMKTVTIDTVVDASTFDPVAGNDRINLSEANSGVTVSGKAEAGATVVLQFGTTTAQTLTANATTGIWTTSYTSSQLPADGARDVTINVTDIAGNTATLTKSVTIDRAVPATPVVTGMSNDYGTVGDYITDRNAVFITGTAEANTRIRMTIGTVETFANVDSNGNWVSPQINLASVAFGNSFNVDFAVTDAADNFSSAVTRTVTRQLNQTAATNAGTMDAATGFTVAGARSQDRIVGFATGNIGGVGNSFNDLIFGSMYATNASAQSTGAVSVLYGTTSWAGKTTVDLLNIGTNLGWVLQGVQNGGNLGSGVGIIGDLDGNGYDELIVGASGVTNGGTTGAGAAYIVWGTGNAPVGSVSDGARTVLNADQIFSAQGFVFRGLTSGEQLGNATLGISSKTVGTTNLKNDFNGDGLADFFIGSRYFDKDPSVNTDNAGAVVVVFGRADLNYGTLVSGRQEMTINDLKTENGVSNGIVIRGATAGDNAGHSISSAGDVNGDGVTDLLIGAPGVDRGTFTLAGAVYVVYGKAAGKTYANLIDDPTKLGRKILDLATLQSSDGFMIQGESQNGSFGASVEGLGDIDGDGFADIVIGAGAAAPINQGKAYVVFGSKNGPVVADGQGRQILDTATISASQGFILNGVPGWLGQSVGAAGDVNKDGLADFIVSAPFSSGISPLSSGQSYVIFGKPKGVGWGNSSAAAPIFNLLHMGVADGFAIAGRIVNDNLGNPDGNDSSIIAPGDLNNDGVDDLFINNFMADSLSRNNNGEAVFFYGTAGRGSLTRTGTSAADVLNGGDMADTITGLGGIDVLRGFAGNDRIEVGDMLFGLVDGGTGTDTFAMTASTSAGYHLNLSTLATGQAIKDIEVIDMIATATTNTLTVTQQTLLDLSSTTDVLRVLGDAGDTVNAVGFTLASIGTSAVNGITYNKYTSGSAELWVQQGVVVTLPAAPVGFVAPAVGFVAPDVGFVAPETSWTNQAVFPV